MKDNEKLKAAKEKSKGFIGEFKTFVLRGNVMDMAIGVIIGGAFGKIVTSLVDNILMPIIGAIIGGVDFSNLSAKIGDAKIAYGLFIQNVIDFLIVAFCIFLFVKAINKLNDLGKKIKKDEEKPEMQVIEENELSVLKEIRSELKKQNKKTK